MAWRSWSAGMLIVAWVAALVAVAVQSPVRAADSVIRYTSDGELVKPADFREWVFLGSGLGMTYTPAEARPAAAANRPPAFTNVYVNPSSYREFMKTGTWPDQTMLILEIRASASEGSINLGGRYQTGLLAVEANVKDSSRPTAWTFYDFGRNDRAKPLPTTAECYTCHGKNTAVDNTFVQFYPMLLEVAKQKGTAKGGH